MKTTRRETLTLLGGAVAATVVPSAVLAATVHEVRMLNKHPNNPRERLVFHPDIVRAKVGDTIRFIAADRGHNSAVNSDMMPAGGTQWTGKVSSDVEVVIETAGAYGYRCQPHASSGMVGLILVGDVSGNYEAVKAVRQRGKAQQRYDDIFARADALLAAE